MSGRIKLFIVLSLVAVAAAYFFGDKKQRPPSPKQAPASTEHVIDGTAPQNMVLYGTIKGERIQLRRAPGGSAFAYLSHGQRVTILSDSRERAWVEVRAGALSGWVSLSDIAFDGE